MDSSLTLPQPALTDLLRHDAVAYTPTSLEQGTKHFTLPAELLKYSVYNFVDLEGLNERGVRVQAKGDLEDKDILTSIEELERESGHGFNSTSVITANNSNNSQSNSQSNSQPITQPSTQNSAKSQPKFSRPDVTWLRRTEYISSVKNNPNNNVVPTLDDSKALLGNPVKFEEIVEEVEGSFEMVKNAVHPQKPKLTLLQSFPIFFDKENTNVFAHCLFLGDSSVTDQSILKLDPLQPIVNLFNPTISPDTLKSHGQFDIQKSTTEIAKSFVLMLPTEEMAKQEALLAKISSTFSLRKKRNQAGKANGKVKKAEGILMKVTRKQ